MRLVRVRIVETKAGWESLSRGEMKVFASIAPTAAFAFEPDATAPLKVDTDADLTVESRNVRGTSVCDEAGREHPVVLAPTLLPLRQPTSTATETSKGGSGHRAGCGILIFNRGRSQRSARHCIKSKDSMKEHFCQRRGLGGDANDIQTIHAQSAAGQD